MRGFWPQPRVSQTRTLIKVFTHQADYTGHRIAKVNRGAIRLNTLLYATLSFEVF